LKQKAKEKLISWNSRQKSSLQNGPAIKWAMPKRATTKWTAPKWSRHKVVYPLQMLASYLVIWRLRHIASLSSSIKLFKFCHGFELKSWQTDS